MDLKSEIEKEHSKQMALKVVEYVGNNPNRFKQLVNIFLEGPYRITQRASWPLSICIENNPGLVIDQLNPLLNFLKKPNIHPAAKRNILRLLQFISIPKRYHGKVATVCFDFLQSSAEPVAIKVFAMSALAQVVQHEPELKNELRIILEDQMPYGSPGFVSRARKVLKAIQ